jgi:hypothetical protein
MSLMLVHCRAQRKLMQDWIKQARHTLPSLPSLDDTLMQGLQQAANTSSNTQAAAATAAAAAKDVQIHSQQGSSHVASSVRRMLRYASVG